MAEKGFGDHHIPADGEWHGFPFPDDDAKPHGSARLKINGSRISGLVKDWRESGKAILKWDGPPEDNLTPAEKAARKKARQEEVLQEAHLLCSKPDAPNNHPYLVRKGLTNNHGALKQDGADLSGRFRWSILGRGIRGAQERGSAGRRKRCEEPAATLCRRLHRMHRVAPAACDQKHSIPRGGGGLLRCGISVRLMSPSGHSRHSRHPGVSGSP
jgi:hypothetical protein